MHRGYTAMTEACKDVLDAYRDGCDPPEGYQFSQGYTDPANQALLVYYRPQYHTDTERDLVLDIMRHPRLIMRNMSPSTAVECFLPGGLIIRHQDLDHLESMEVELSRLFQVVRLPGQDGVPGANTGAIKKVPTSSIAATQTTKWDKCVGTDLRPSATTETMDVSTELDGDVPWHRDGLTQVLQPCFAKWMQTPKATNQECPPATWVTQDGLTTQAKSRTMPQTADGSTEVESDAPLNFKVATQPSWPARTTSRMQTPDCALQVGDHTKVPPLSQSCSQEEEEDDATTPAEQEPSQGRRPCTRMKKTACMERATQPQSMMTAPREAIESGTNLERTITGSHYQDLCTNKNIDDGIVKVELQTSVSPKVENEALDPRSEDHVMMDSYINKNVDDGIVKLALQTSIIPKVENEALNTRSEDHVVMPAADIKDEIVIEEQPIDQVIPSLKEENNVKNVAVVTEGPTNVSCKAIDQTSISNYRLQISRPYSCSVCNSSFAQKCSLNRHTSLHSNQKPHCCVICNQMFAYKSSLRNHMNTHSGEKPYSCKICNKRFNFPGSLKTHLVLHSPDRPYSCSICSRTFNHKSSHNAHLLTHGGERPYTCKICNSAFTRSGHLKMHMVTHSEERPYSCSVCNKAFSRKGTLTIHLRTHSVGKGYSR